MASDDHSSFKERLKTIGIVEVPVFDGADPCTHSFDTKCVLYINPDEEEEDSFFGWHKYEGCFDCVTDLGGVFFCGGLYRELRIFKGDAALE